MRECLFCPFENPKEYQQKAYHQSFVSIDKSSKPVRVRGSAPVIEKGADIKGNSFVSARGGGYASARSGRSASARGGGYATALGGEFASAKGSGVASVRDRRWIFASASGGGFASASCGGFAGASCGGFVKAVFDDDDYVFIVSSSDEEYMCNSEEMTGNHSSGNDDENYEDKDWQDKDDGNISDYKSDDNCGVYSSDDDGQIRIADRYALKDFSIQQGFKLVRDKNKKNRVTAHCGIKGCKWRIHASTLPNGVTFKIKTIGRDHICVREARNSIADSNWIAGKMATRLRAEPNLKLDGMHVEVFERFGVEVL
ncbi:hypothetical protein F0562_012217 [Nyssa sinensis]|uniref:Transposase MuDR plant domain-containing protein n=1 Tax=Nyssa sinensis TaxID=561372 RepID=A0A5J4ZUI6_9ASTE|nr:hypothetical protein F0562_012217 [Nyssa sinensis]